MNKQNEIEKIINIIEDVNEIYVREIDDDGFSDLSYSDRYNINYKVAKELVDAGYRKESEVRKQMAKELIDSNKLPITFKYQLAAQYDIEIK